MHGFTPPPHGGAALAWLDAQLRTLDAEDVPLRAAAGRVLATSIVSDIDVPGFDRATMDGYAVVADSTEGATPYNRVAAEGHRRRAAGLAVRGHDRARRGGAHHDRRADAGRRRRRCCRRSPSMSTSRARADSPPRTSDHRRDLRRLARKNVGQRGEDIVRGTTLLEPGACCVRRTSA